MEMDFEVRLENFLIEVILSILPIFWTPEMFFVAIFMIAMIFIVPIYYFIKKKWKKREEILMYTETKKTEKEVNMFLLSVKTFFLFLWIIIVNIFLAVSILYKMSIMQQFPQLQIIMKDDYADRQTIIAKEKIEGLEKSEKFAKKVIEWEWILNKWSESIENNINISRKYPCMYGNYSTTCEDPLIWEIVKIFQYDLYRFNAEVVKFLKYTDREYLKNNLDVDGVFGEENQRNLEIFAKKLKNTISQHEKFAFVKDFSDEDAQKILEGAQVLYIVISDSEKEIKNKN